MPDYLDILANDAVKSIEEGYYENPSKAARINLSLRDAILRCLRAPIISEIKFASPSGGNIREKHNFREIANDMERGGSIGISILTEPIHFNGSINFMAEIREQIRIPLLMKDIILSPLQIESAYKTGADALLLIQTLFERGYCEKNVQEMIDYSHSKGLEVLLETHTEDEFNSALKTRADMIGINNRDLKTLKVDLNVTKHILTRCSSEGRLIVSESGINTPEDIRFLQVCGAKAFLVGTAVMKERDVQKKVRELVEAI